MAEMMSDIGEYAGDTGVFIPQREREKGEHRTRTQTQKVHDMDREMTQTRYDQGGQVIVH